MRKVLISGITGFVGVNLAQYLNSNYNVLGVSRSETKECISYEDLQSKGIENDIDAFIHLAGKAHDVKGVSDDTEYYDVNTNLTKKIFNQFLESDCKTFIFLSSVKAVADTVKGVLVEEDTPMPETVYGKSKLEAEKYILSLDIPEGKKVFILRPCMIHGPQNKGNLNLLYKFVSKGLPYPLGGFENERSFLSVENLCFIVKRLIEGDISSGVYNVSDDGVLSTNELVKLIGNVTGRNVKILKINASLLKFFAKMGDYLKLPLNTHRLDKLTENYRVSNEKIKKALGTELPISAKEGIVKTLSSF